MKLISAIFMSAISVYPTLGGAQSGTSFFVQLNMQQQQLNMQQQMSQQQIELHQMQQQMLV